MSTYSYLIDKESKIKIAIRNVDKETFLENASKIEKAMPEDYDAYEEDYIDLLEKPIDSFTIGDYDFLLRAAKFLYVFISSYGPIYAYLYYISVIKEFDYDWDYICEYDEKEMEKYEDYISIG